MKKMMITVLALVMMLSALAAMAQDNKINVTPKLALNVAMDKTQRTYLGNQYGILVEGSYGTFPVGLEVGYLAGEGSELTVTWTDGQAYYADKDKFKTTSFPIMATYKHVFTEGLYGKVGLGCTFNKLKVDSDYYIAPERPHYSASEKKTNFAFELGVGYKFMNNFNMELLYANYGKFQYPDGLSYEGKDNLKSSNIQINFGYNF